MANVKITDMTPGAALSGTERFEAVQAAGTVSVLASQVKTYTLTAPVVLTEVVGSSDLTLTGATQTASFPVLNATQTWNNGAVTFTGIKFNATSTASAAGSLLLDLQLGGVSQFSVNKSGLLTTAGGRVRAVRVITAAGAITVAVTDDVVVVNKTVGAASAVALPAGVTGQVFVIKDGKGDAAANNITITPAAGTIDGAATYVMNTNYQSVTLIYNATQWNVT